MSFVNGIFNRLLGRNRCAEEAQANQGYIISSSMDDELNEIEDALNKCFLDDGTKPMTGNLPMGGNIITGYGPDNADIAGTTEGTFIPDVEDLGINLNNWVSSKATGTYTTIGNMVFFTMELEGGFVGVDTGNFNILNLPETASTEAARYSVVADHINFSSEKHIRARVVPNTTNIKLYKVAANGIETELDGTDFQDPTLTVFISGQYRKS